jgi:hypothetical protein
MSNEEHQFKVIATKTITATFDVYAEDEDEARDEIEMAVHGYDVIVSDAVDLVEDEWDVSTIEEVGMT